MSGELKALWRYFICHTSYICSHIKTFNSGLRKQNTKRQWFKLQNIGMLFQRIHWSTLFSWDEKRQFNIKITYHSFRQKIYYLCIDIPPIEKNIDLCINAKVVKESQKRHTRKKMCFLSSCIYNKTIITTAEQPCKYQCSVLFIIKTTDRSSENTFMYECNTSTGDNFVVRIIPSLTFNLNC